MENKQAAFYITTCIPISSIGLRALIHKVYDGLPRHEKGLARQDLFPI